MWIHTLGGQAGKKDWGKDVESPSLSLLNLNIESRTYERLEKMSAFACRFHTYNHIFQGMFGKPAVQKDWDKEIP